MTKGPHQGERVVATGARLDEASGAMIMVHGRGATPESIVSLASLMKRPDFAYLAPAAAGGAWYPYGFMSPLEANEPGITSGLQALEDLLGGVEESGIPAERTVLLGFSQGACLATEFAARNARRFGGVVGLSGGLIGPDDTPRDYAGSLAGTPVFLGCSDSDFHIPAARVEQTAEVLRRMGAEVEMRLYPGLGHEINHEEIRAAQRIMAAAAPPPA